MTDTVNVPCEVLERLVAWINREVPVPTRSATRWAMDITNLLAAAPKVEPEKTDPQVAFENMRRHFPNDRREWADLTEEDRKGWEEDVQERPYLYDLSRPTPKAEPVEVTIFCPKCSLPHVDEGEWASTRHHKTHQCQGCGNEWRPFPFATVGVSHPEAPKVERSLKWHRLGDVLPEQRAILIASKKEGEDFWRVRDAVMQVRYEGVFPHVSDLANGNRPVTWWFDSIYPGKGDCRLAHEDLLWAYIPTPDDHPAPASDELLEALEAEIARLRPHYQGRGLDQARVQMLDHFADFIAKHKESLS